MKGAGEQAGSDEVYEVYDMRLDDDKPEPELNVRAGRGLATHSESISE